jgi:hypothetical protein
MARAHTLSVCMPGNLRRSRAIHKLQMRLVARPTSHGACGSSGTQIFCVQHLQLLGLSITITTVNTIYKTTRAGTYH